jgi:hypothetical protein
MQPVADLQIVKSEEYVAVIIMVRNVMFFINLTWQTICEIIKM